MTTSRTALLLLPVLLLTACKGQGDAAKGGPPKGPSIVRIAIATPERVDRIVELTGTLSGLEEVTVSAEVDGRVERVAADLGDAVAQGAVLVQLADAEPRLRAAQAEAEYLQTLAKLGIDDGGLEGFVVTEAASVKRAKADDEEAKKNLERGEELTRRGLAAQGELDTLRTRARVTEAALQAAVEGARGDRASAMGKRAAAGLARKKVRDCAVGSPVKGLVARRHVSLGQYVKAGQSVMDVVIADPLRLRGEAPERYAGVLTAELPVAVRIDALGRTVEGKLSRVGPSISGTSRTFPVEALVPNDGALQPGLFARATVRVGADEEVFALPETAVATLAGVTKVYVEIDGKAAERRVTLLRKRGSDALVAGELKAGERVILTAIARLFDGAEVKVDEGPDVAPATPPAREATGGQPDKRG